MKLYTHPGSCSSASHIALLEAKLDFEPVKLDLKTDRKLPDGRQLSDINPKNYVPVLELDNGELLTENVAILQYIADRNPDAGLAPAAGTMERLRLQEWLGFTNSELHKGSSMLFMPDLPDATRKMVIERLNGRLQFLDRHLSNNQYLMGEQFTVADAYLFIVLSWAPMLGYDLGPYNNITAYQERVGQRETVKKVVAEASH